jgi:hypothetical protein
MRRRTVLSSALVLIALTVLTSSLIGAQQGTPAAGGSVGVGGGGLGSGEPEAAPGYILWLRRGTFEPGGYVSLHHRRGALVLSVESGSLTDTAAEGVAVVTRAATEGTPGPTEEIGPGMETVLQPGDSVIEQGVVHTSRNDGDEPTTVLIAALTAAGQQFTQYHEEATPAA